MTMLRSSAGRKLLYTSGWLVIGFLVLPLLIVAPVSLTPERYLSLPTDISFRHYLELMTDPAWRKGVLDSFVVATVSSLLAVALGTSAAIGCWRLSSTLGEVIRIIMLTPMIVPSIVHALGMYRVWVEFGIIDSYPGLIIAYAMKGTPYVLVAVSVALANFDLRLEQAARSLGARPTQAVRLILLPNIWPGALAGGVLAFAIAWDEIVVALFLTRRAVYTLPRKIWDGIQDNISPSIAAIGVILILATICAVLLRILWERWSADRARSMVS